VGRDYSKDRLLEEERFAEITVKNSGEVATVLHAERKVEAERVAKLLQILCPRAFAEHLLHGIAGDNVREQKNHCED